VQGVPKRTSEELYEEAVGELEDAVLSEMQRDPSSEPGDVTDGLSQEVCSRFNEKHPGRHVSRYDVAAEVKDRIARRG